MKLLAEIQSIATNRHIDHFGIADLAGAREFIAAQGGEQLDDYRRAISIGLNLFHDIVDQLPNRKTRAVSVAYKQHCYDIINNRLDLIASEISSVIQKAGFRVLPIPASKRVSDEKLAATFSHKLAANLCGLGWIGKSCLLVTPTAGPRVRFATILTDAPLAPTGSPMENRCGDCLECVDICPVNAFTGRTFDENEPREERYDAHKCEQYFKSMWKVNDWAVCGMCLYICPFGKNRAQ